ncbi:MAG TPA: cytochrome c oxidase assembly protein [Bryobacteraceae bacterium]|nr:cytochrome c oxidase assembly protein [Bryobacteraceae bacterium]
MNTIGSAALGSWNIDVPVLALLVITALIYLRGWLRGQRFVRDEQDGSRLAAFLSGLAVLFIALDSPLDAFDTLYLSAHMTQHLLLMMVAPPLLLIGRPMLPLLRGLPKWFVKEGLGPFLAWPALRRVLSFLVFPPFAWLVYVASTILWHLPKFYELVLQSPFWHGAQHACFFWTAILFWWPVIQPAPGRAAWPRWTMIPYLLFADVANTALSAFFVFSGDVLYPNYETLQGHVAAARDQAFAGVIMWVPGSIAYLVPAIVMALSIFNSGRLARRRLIKPARVRSRLKLPLPMLRRVAQTVMLGAAVVVMADGFFGTQVAPLNKAGVWPWIYWRGLSVLALLAVGNLFCMACPFTLARDVARKIVPPRFRWPQRLRNKWTAVALLALYLWTYEAFSLWNSPWLTAWVIAGYFGTALLVDGFFRGASFCKYVCPIGQFHFISSLVSPGEIGVRKKEVCQTCRTYDCIRGNAHARGCELYLFQPKKTGNLDCTFCLDCVKACPHDNVAYLPVIPASTLVSDPYRSSLGRLSKRNDLAALVLVMVFGAFVNAAGMVGPVSMWEHGWQARLGLHTLPWIVAGLVFGGVIAAPALAVMLCGGLNRLIGLMAETVRRFILALAPIGFAMWCAHLVYHLSTPFGVPVWMTDLQILVLDSGLLLTLYVCWRVAQQNATKLRRELAIVAPWAALSCVLYGVGIWILLQPMQMRGMS